jgi:hypothetical protein
VLSSFDRAQPPITQLLRDVLTDSLPSFTSKQHVADRENRHQWYALQTLLSSSVSSSSLFFSVFLKSHVKLAGEFSTQQEKKPIYIKQNND